MSKQTETMCEACGTTDLNGQDHACAGHELIQERNRYKVALTRLAKLGKPHGFKYGNSEGNVMAIKALYGVE